MNTYGRVDVYIHMFLNWGWVEVSGLIHDPVVLPARKGVSLVCSGQETICSTVKVLYKNCEQTLLLVGDKISMMGHGVLPDRFST
jgi:hypothetical protein